MNNDIASMPLIDYYGVLGIVKESAEDEIKKAYKKMALRYHPDKSGNTPESVERFQTVSRAYQVLSDPKKRKIYDRYGSRGVAMMEQMGEVAPFIDPDMILAMNWFFILASIVCGLLIMFPAFLSVKADGIVDWTWLVVFVPLFIIDCMLIYFLLMLPEQSPSDELSEEISPTSTSKRMRFKKYIKRMLELYLGRLVRWTYVLSFVVLQILVALKLDSRIKASWFIVFVPWFIIEFFNFMIHSFGLIVMLKTGKIHALHPETFDEEGQPMGASIESTPYSKREVLFLVWDSYISWILRVAQVILLCSRIDGIMSISWPIVFIPFYLIGIFKIVDLIYEWKAVKRSPSENSREIFKVRLTFLITCCIFFYLGIGLLVARLESDDSIPTAAVILIPVFIVFSILFCCFCCCLPLIAYGARSMVEEELKKQPEQQPPNSSTVDLGSQKKIVWISADSKENSLVLNDLSVDNGTGTSN